MGNSDYITELADNTPISLVNIAGTHDSCSANISFKTIARCQNLTVSEQLNAGIRFLDIRLYFNKDKFFLVHSMADCFKDSERKIKLLFDDVFSDCLAFLKKHPGETIIMSIKKDRGASCEAFPKMFYKNFIEGKEKFWYLKNNNPVLGDVRGKIVLIRRFKLTEGYNFLSENNDFGLDFTAWRQRSGKDLTLPFKLKINEKLYAYIQDNYNLIRYKKWSDSAKPFFENFKPSSEIFCINFLSSAAGVFIPEKNAHYINSDFYKYDINNKNPLGWIIMDFAEEKFINKIIYFN